MGYREIPWDLILVNTKTISAKHAEDTLKHKAFFVKGNSTDDTLEEGEKNHCWKVQLEKLQASLT